MFICFVLLFFSTGYSQTKSVTVDFNSSTTKLKDLLGINVGPDKSPLGYTDAGIKWVRTHDYYGPCDYNNYTNFYNPATKTFDPAFDPYNSANYSWLSSDYKMDSIARFGLTPYFRLGYSYPQLSTPVTPPFDSDGRSFTKFAGICKMTVMHYSYGWNSGFYYAIPYWEILNEPDNTYFWKGTPSNYYNLYKAVSDTLKAYNPNLKVGGPGAVAFTIVTHNKTYLDDFLSFCQTNNVKLDFYSWHMYGMVNPYCLKSYADTVKNMLNYYGFPYAESHVTEINRELSASSPYNDSPKGAAYIASTLITSQDTYIDKYFWYRGTKLPGSLFNDDTLGAPNLTWNAYSYKMMSYLIKETPNKLVSTGNEVVEFNRTKDTTNLMILSGKSDDGQKVYVMISNLKSIYKQLNVVLNNLPWSPLQVVEIKINTVKNGSRYLETRTTSLGGSSMAVTITNVDTPAVYLVRLSLTNVNLSGKITLDNTTPTPLPGAKLTFSGALLNDSTFTDSDGNYTMQLPANWTGTVTPSKINYTFTPALLQFSNVLESLTNQNFVAKSITSEFATVWPGDTNNDGIVNQADILPIGFYWNASGPARQNASTAWLAQSCSLWTPAAAVYADANGNGTVNQEEILAIGLNWNKTHSTLKNSGLYRFVSATSTFLIDNISKNQDEIYFKLKIDPADKTLKNIFGISFEVDYSASSKGIEEINIYPENDLTGKVLNYSHPDKPAGKIGFGVAIIQRSDENNTVNPVVFIKLKSTDIKNIQNIKIKDINAITNDGVIITLKDCNINLNLTDIMDKKTIDCFELKQNYPNPFNPNTRIEYQIPQESYVTLKIYNALGQEIKTLVNRKQNPGVFHAEFNASYLPSGIYFYRLTTDNFSEMKKMILQK